MKSVESGRGHAGTAVVSNRVHVRRGLHKCVAALVLATVGLATSAVASAAPAPVKPTNRQEAVDVVQELRRIVTPNGVERAEHPS